MCGSVPFGENLEDPFELYEEIIKNQIEFPDYFKDLEAKAFLN